MLTFEFGGASCEFDQDTGQVYCRENQVIEQILRRYLHLAPPHPEDRAIRLSQLPGVSIPVKVFNPVIFPSGFFTEGEDLG